MRDYKTPLIFGTAFLYCIGQLCTGTDPYVALLFSLAILFGLCSIRAAGGFRTAFGTLNAIIVAKFLLIGIALKVLILDPSDRNLLSPESTAAVMALGFLGLLAGTWTLRYLPKPRRPLLTGTEGTKIYLALTVVFLFLGYGGYVVGLSPDLAGEGLRTGGILGFARTLGSVKSFAVVPALFFVWSRKSPRFMTHPLVLSTLAMGIVCGLFTSAKQDAIETLSFYILVGTMRYGIGYRPLWGLTALSLVYYGAVVYPYSQFVRDNGGRQGNLSERLRVMNDVFWNVATDADFRKSILTRTDDPNASYLGSESLKPFGRLAMVGEADKLVAATIEHQSFTGWYTITWGLKLALPSFVYPDKPVFGTGNYLAHLTGEVGPDDTTTQVGYGVMANLFNAFSYLGVFLGSVLFFSCFYYLLGVFFGDPKWTGHPHDSALWFCFIITMFHHSLVEESVAGLVASVNVLAVTWVMNVTAKRMCLLTGRVVSI
jgi:hypothetical protein